MSQSGFEPVLAYVQTQRERHTSRELHGVLERTDDEAGSQKGSVIVASPGAKAPGYIHPKHPEGR